MTASDIRSRGEDQLADVRARLERLEASPPTDRAALMHAVDEIQLALQNVAIATMFIGARR